MLRLSKVSESEHLKKVLALKIKAAYVIDNAAKSYLQVSLISST